MIRATNERLIFRPQSKPARSQSSHLRCSEDLHRYRIDHGNPTYPGTRGRFLKPGNRDVEQACRRRPLWLFDPVRASTSAFGEPLLKTSLAIGLPDGIEQRDRTAGFPALFAAARRWLCGSKAISSTRTPARIDRVDEFPRGDIDNLYLAVTVTRPDLPMIDDDDPSGPIVGHRP